MRRLLLASIAIVAFATPAFAIKVNPKLPTLNEQTAQPECGFAATQDFGPNGYQACDPKSMYPKFKSLH